MEKGFRNKLIFFFNFFFLHMVVEVFLQLHIRFVLSCLLCEILYLRVFKCLRWTQVVPMT